MGARPPRSARLRIHRETIRTLSHGALAAAVGGVTWTIGIEQLPEDNPATDPKSNGWGRTEPAASCVLR